MDRAGAALSMSAVKVEPETGLVCVAASVHTDQPDHVVPPSELVRQSTYILLVV